MDINKTRAHYEEVALAAEMLAALENLLIACPDETFQDGQRLRIQQVARLNGTIVMAKAVLAKVKS